MTRKISTLIFSFLFAAFCYGQNPVDLPVTFDNASVTYTLTDFGGNTSMVATDPVVSSNKAAQVTKTNTAQTWAGTTIGPANGFASRIPLTPSTTKMTMRVYSPDTGIVIRLKAEDPNDPTKSVETDAKTTKKNAWETLEFNFANQAAGTAAINYSYTYQKLSVFFNFNVSGATAGTQVYYCDDIQMMAGTLAQIDLPVTFDAASIDYTMLDFGGNTSSVVADPAGGANKVGKAIKDNTAQTWAGTTVGTGAGFATKIPFTANTSRMTMKVFSPDTGIVIRLKAEDPANNTITVETDAKTTVKNAWETLTFNFANQATGTPAIDYAKTYQKLSVFFNFNVSGATAGSKTYYFDDIQMGAPLLAQISLPVRFDSANVDYTMIDFGGNTSSVVADPAGGANKVGKAIKDNTAQTWAGTTIGTNAGFAAKIPFTANTPKMTMKVYAPDTGLVIRLKAEDPNNATISVETDAKTTVKNGWQTLEFNFANQATGTAAIDYSKTYQKLSVFFNFNVSGATAGALTFYFDDVQMGAPLFSQLDLPVTFDANNVDYSMIDFGGNVSSVVADPINAANKVGKAIKGNTAELWAGTTVGTNAGFANKVPFSAGNTKMSMKVYSPNAGILVKMKVEDPNDPTKSVETDVTTTVANAWEMLTFNFANQSSGTAAINFATNYKKLSVFFNFGVTGATAGTKTYYFDSIAFGGGATPPPSTVNVTFRVDLKNFTVLPTDTVTLNGTFNNWCGACAPMTNVSGTKIYFKTLALDTSKEYEFKYAIGNWTKQETMTAGLSCVKTTGAFTNRVYKTTKSNDTLPLVCWQTCGTCFNAGISKSQETGFTMYPNPATHTVHINLGNASVGNATISIYNLLGALVLNQNVTENQADINISSLKPGMYLVKSNVNGIENTIKLQVN